MPQPKSPVVLGLEPYEVIWGEGQENVISLPSLRGKGPTYEVYSRWEPTSAERIAIVAGADIYLVQQTNGNKFQPSKLIISHPATNAIEKDKIIQALGLTEELDERLSYLLDKAFND